VSKKRTISSITQEGYDLREEGQQTVQRVRAIFVQTEPVSQKGAHVTRKREAVSTEKRRTTEGEKKSKRTTVGKQRETAAPRRVDSRTWKTCLEK